MYYNSGLFLCVDEMSGEEFGHVCSSSCYERV